MPASDAQARARNEDAATAGEGSASRDWSRRIGEFLIARGGPFYELHRQLGLLHGRALNAGLRAAILVAIAWGVPLVLSAIAGHAVGPSATHPFLLDLGAWARSSSPSASSCSWSAWSRSACEVTSASSRGRR